jgi:hypothetical protein
MFLHAVSDARTNVSWLVVKEVEKRVMVFSIDVISFESA